MNLSIREKRRSVRENSPTLLAPESILSCLTVNSRPFFGVHLDGRAFPETEPHAFDVIAGAERGLVGVVGPLGAAPVRRCEYLEARDVVAGNPYPRPLFTGGDLQVDVVRFDVEVIHLQGIEPFFYALYLSVYPFSIPSPAQLLSR